VTCSTWQTTMRRAWQWCRTDLVSSAPGLTSLGRISLCQRHYTQITRCASRASWLPRRTSPWKKCSDDLTSNSMARNGRRRLLQTHPWRRAPIRRR
jgi:hypothetical protein